MRTLIIPPVFIGIYSAILLGLTVLLGPGAPLDPERKINGVMATTGSAPHMPGRPEPDLNRRIDPEEEFAEEMSY